MGHQFTIEDEEAVELAHELAALTGESLNEAVAEALRLRLATARRERAEMDKARTALAAFHELLDNPRPGSDHGWMYDEKTGLPIW